jgi:hypothetical protein
LPLFLVAAINCKGDCFHDLSICRHLPPKDVVIEMRPIRLSRGVVDILYIDKDRNALQSSFARKLDEQHLTQNEWGLPISSDSSAKPRQNRNDSRCGHGELVVRQFEKGRTIDHIGFEVDNLEAFTKQLQAKGIKLGVPMREIADTRLSTPSSLIRTARTSS